MQTKVKKQKATVRSPFVKGCPQAEQQIKAMRWLFVFRRAGIKSKMQYDSSQFLS